MSHIFCIYTIVFELINDDYDKHWGVILSVIPVLLFSVSSISRFRRQSHFSATVADFGNKLSPKSATVWTRFKTII